MSNDWGKPWGKPAPNTVNPADTTPEELTAKGWVQPAHDEWEKIAPDTSPFAGARVTIAFVDEADTLPPFEDAKSSDGWVTLQHDDADRTGPFFVAYFGRINYCVLAGPYDTEEEARAAFDRVWSVFEADASLSFTFPTKDRASLEAVTLDNPHRRTGAYGKL